MVEVRKWRGWKGSECREDFSSAHAEIRRKNIVKASVTRTLSSKSSLSYTSRKATLSVIA